MDSRTAEDTVVERKLAAILAADVAGYSSLMGRNEVGTLRILTEYRGNLGRLIAGYRGRIFTTAGDSVTAEFASAVDALSCAIAVQKTIAEANAARPEEERMQFRIGLHLGDIIVQGGDLFGDGVNIAARLQALAAPGGICLSGALREQIGSNLDIGFADLGEQHVKNIGRPVRAYAVAPAGAPGRRAALRPGRRRLALVVSVAALLAAAAIGAWQLSTTRQEAPAAGSSAAAVPRAGPAPRLSILVLPFANLSNDPGQQYFADGITEDLTTDLSRIAGSFVISRNTAFQYAGKPVDARQIGRELGVRYVLEGSVRRAGTQARINVQLIDAETDAHLWADRFDRDASDLLALEDEITGRIARAVQAQLYIAEGSRPTDKPDALDFLMRGRAELSKTVSKSSRDAAVGYFEQALTLDPNSVEAQVWLANALVSRVIDETSDNSSADMLRAGTLVEQALRSAPNNAMGYHTRGQLMRVQRRCDDAIPEYQAAIKLDPNLPHAYAWEADCKLKTGSTDGVISLLERAIQLSPQDPSIGPWYWRIGMVQVYRRQPDEAIKWLEKAQAAYAPRGPGSGYWVHGWLAAAYAMKGDSERAKTELNEAWKYPFYRSVAAIKADPIYADSRVWGLAEPTFIAGLKAAGLPAQ
ncbi:MAG TPA: tetratricopeptide repeat protein [Stellaceae bacterium]